MTSPLDIAYRPRRLRLSVAARKLVTETHLQADHLVQPVFVKEEGLLEPVDSMPGVIRYPVSQLAERVQAIQASGVPAIALFPCVEPSLKTEDAAYAFDQANFLFKAIRLAKKVAPDLLVITDVALDPFTSHGHDGLVGANGDVLNDETVNALTRLAVLEAEAGADWVAPSDMMDGRVQAIRSALDRSGAQHVAILAYAAKFASAYYGPFRDAVGSSRARGTSPLDKRTYQLNPGNLNEALREVHLDEVEGADIVMVKPAGPYLDVIRAVRERTLLPVAAYQVSGEYAQIHAAARLGWLTLENVRDEALLAIRRAGAEIIISYFAEEWAHAHR